MEDEFQRIEQGSATRSFRHSRPSASKGKASCGKRLKEALERLAGYMSYSSDTEADIQRGEGGEDEKEALEELEGEEIQYRDIKGEVAGNTQTEI